MFWRRVGQCAIVICIIFLVGEAVHWWDSRGQGFRIEKIHSALPYDSRWDISCSEEDLAVARKALSQPYTYLAHGFQCYVFVSADDRYVLKFFRHQRLRLPDFVLSLPSVPIFDEWRKSRILSLTRRRDYLLRSCKTSWDPARRQTALLMAHLNTTKELFPTVEIHDPLGETHRVALDECQFLLQRKATLIKPTISRLMNQHDIEGAKERIRWIFALLLDCVKNDIQDTDGALIRKNNLGFLEDEQRAIYVDGGKLRRHRWKRGESEKDFARLYLLRKWLKTEYPALLDTFDREKADTISQIETFVDQREEQGTHAEKQSCS